MFHTVQFMSNYVQRKYFTVQTLSVYCASVYTSVRTLCLYCILMALLEDIAASIQ
jgi:hypothetical protein